MKTNKKKSSIHHLKKQLLHNVHIHNVWHFFPSASVHKKHAHNQQMAEQHFHYKLSCTLTWQKTRLKWLQTNLEPSGRATCHIVEMHVKSH